ncbi:hypothetical protein Tco_1320076 [Tanacetum coccineum]
MTMGILPEPTSNKLYGRSNTNARNPVKEILLNLNLPDHMSVLMEPEMEMEIPYSSRVKFITTCSYLIDKDKDMIKAQMKQSKGDNPIAFKIKKVDELRALPSYVLGVTRVQVPEDDLNDLKWIREEDGEVETLDP